MSAAYTLHLPRDSVPGDPVPLERATLVRDGFSWGAFFFPVLWLLYHRHWIGGLITLVVLFGVAVLLAALGVRSGAILLCEFLLHVLIGLEAPSFRSWLYAWRRRPAVDVVQAASLEEAEVKSFGRWLAAAPMAPHGLQSAPHTGHNLFANAPWRRDPEPVIGLFPDAEGRR